MTEEEINELKAKAERHERNATTFALMNRIALSNFCCHEAIVIRHLLHKDAMKKAGIDDAS